MSAAPVDRRRRRALAHLGAVAVAATLPLVTRRARGADPASPKVIRFGVAQGGAGNPIQFGGSPGGIARNKGWLEDEFKRDGIQIEWVFFKCAGPGVNEALATRQLDFAAQGDLPAIVARAGGLKTKLILAGGIRNNTYIGAPVDSDIKSIKDLKGRRVALFKGTNMQLPAARILDANGLSERDLKLINMDTPTIRAALATKDLDAAFTDAGIFLLQEKGVAKVVYSTKQDPQFTRQSHVLVTEEFEQQYPQIVQRVADVIVKASKWASEESNRDELFQLWALGGTPYNAWRKDFEGDQLRFRNTPLWDEFLVARYKDAASESLRLKLIRSSIDVNAWIERKYVDAAVKQQGLVGYWLQFDAKGTLKG